MAFSFIQSEGKPTWREKEARLNLQALWRALRKIDDAIKNYLKGN